MYIYIHIYIYIYIHICMYVCSHTVHPIELCIVLLAGTASARPAGPSPRAPVTVFAPWSCVPSKNQTISEYLWLVRTLLVTYYCPHGFL